MRRSRRVAAGVVVLAVLWTAAFNVTALPFLPTVVAGALVGGALALWARAGGTPASRPWPRPTVAPRHVLLAVGVALVHVGVSHLLFAAGAALLPAIGDTARGVYDRTGVVGVLPRLLLSGLVVAPLEEVFWRGAFHPAVRDAVVPRFPRLPPAAVAIVASTAAYTLFHITTWRISLVAAAVLGGLVWSWLLEHTRSLAAPMIAHALWTCLLILHPVA